MVVRLAESLEVPLRERNALLLAAGAVVLATQSPSQLAQLPNRHTVVDSCPTRIYLPNPDATTPAQAQVTFSGYLEDLPTVP